MATNGKSYRVYDRERRYNKHMADLYRAILESGKHERRMFRRLERVFGNACRGA